MLRIILSCATVLFLTQSTVRSVPALQTDSKAKPQKSRDFVFEIQPREISPGQPATLRWSIKGATKVLIEEAVESGILHKLGEFGASGSIEVQPEQNTTYVLTCEGSTSFTCASATVKVRVKR